MKQELINLTKEVGRDIYDITKKIDEDCMYNSKKVIEAFHRNNISEMHLNRKYWIWS